MEMYNYDVSVRFVNEKSELFTVYADCVDSAYCTALQLLINKYGSSVFDEIVLINIYETNT